MTLYKGFRRGDEVRREGVNSSHRSPLPKHLDICPLLVDGVCGESMNRPEGPFPCTGGNPEGCGIYIRKRMRENHQSKESAKNE